MQDMETTGLAWWPGRHTLAFGQALDPDYFGRMGPDPALARGIRAYDADHPDVRDLVPPVRGYHLADPKFSPDGRYLSIREIDRNEGAGPLVIYNLETEEYIPWDVRAGSMSWGAYSQTIYYDDLTYIPQGGEAIYTRVWDGRAWKGEPQLFSMKVENGYAYLPEVSPDGSLVAYLVDRDGLDANTVSVVIADVASGEQRETGGVFENVSSIGWSAGWAHILLTGDSWSAPVIYLINPFDGSKEVLVQGSQPAWNPAIPLQ
jgi:Tol biopolymer transport system component